MDDRWELYDGTTINGPFSESALLDSIRRGLPATVMVRRVGSSEWGSLRTHAPFAHALEQAASAAAAARPINPAPFVVAPSQTVIVQAPSNSGGCSRIIGLLMLLMFVVFIGPCIVAAISR